MTTSKSLPARPSLESLRKQARQLARRVAAGDPSAIARARAQLPNATLPLNRRNAQLVLAREYGYAGWKDLIAEVSRRLGHGLEWAVSEARRVIHDNDVERLKQLIAEYPALLTWKDDDEPGGLLEMATGAYGDVFDPTREGDFTRAECAEVLIDAGAHVSSSVTEGFLRTRARGLMQLFEHKGLLPRTLKYRAALGDFDGVHSGLSHEGNDVSAVTEAFVRACGFKHEAIAALLLDRLIALDPEFGQRVDGSVGRVAFIAYAIKHGLGDALKVGPWKAFVMTNVVRSIHDNDLPVFLRALKNDPWLLEDSSIEFQNEVICTATLKDRREFITAFFDLAPAILRRQPPLPSQAIEFAVCYRRAHLVPLLTRIWPLPDDLPHAAGTGNLARVQQWFDASGAPALVNVFNHFPHTGIHQEIKDPWDASPLQKVLDTALAWAVINDEFEVADFLLAHGADINTRWNSHEPASILHNLVFEGTYESMQFVIDRGIDMTIRDYRWNSTAEGWARYGKGDEKMAQWLADAERQRESKRGGQREN